MIDYVKDWYLVKYERNDETILSNFTHKDMIDSLLKILQHDDEGTIILIKEEMYRVIYINFEPSTGNNSYNVLHIEIEEFDL